MHLIGLSWGLNEHWHKEKLSQLLFTADITHKVRENTLIYLNLRLICKVENNNISAEFPLVFDTMHVKQHSIWM